MRKIKKPGPSAVVRRFGLLDLMILIAALALGLFWTKQDIGYLWTERLELKWSDFITGGDDVSYKFVIALTSAFVYLRLRQPRPNLRRLSRQPGWIAGITAIMMMVFLAGYHSCSMLRTSLFLITFDFEASIELVDYIAFWSRPYVGIAVTVSWLTLAISRRWHNEKSWIDRAGRILGFLWILSLPRMIVSNILRSP